MTKIASIRKKKKTEQRHNKEEAENKLILQEKKKSDGITRLGNVAMSGERKRNK